MTWTDISSIITAIAALLAALAKLVGSVRRPN